MFIMNAAGNMIVNMAQSTAVTIKKQEDAVVLMVGQIDGSTRTIGRYNTDQEARQALTDLFTALYDGSLYYEMPQRRQWSDDRTIYDRRAQRKGGS